MKDYLFTNNQVQVVDENGKTLKVFDTENEAELFIQVSSNQKYLNSFGKLQLELLTKGRNYILDNIPSEDVKTEDDLYNYPIPEYEELYQVMIDNWETTQQNLFSKSLVEMLDGLRTDVLGEYVDTRFDCW